ncbi:hypothetical protein I5M32_03650 [Pedobacter sp. SD-b]|uniref:Uncharacterized protein n=1 Tax=Pedobacter segetis TaxID=2793069 RepID=A0ABS1BIL6_9SPHI|nr:hypothetical protein [Pedobacter segetis]MBK0382044.1 hypothetical protein [Pedobacter segetis]
MDASILHIPENIADSEILVRFIFDSDFKNKKIEITKVIEGGIFLDTRDLGVSLQRHLFCNEQQCKKIACNIQNKNYVGFVIFKKEDFQKTKEEHKKEREEFEAVILFTPLDEGNNIIEDKTNIYTNTPKNPSHSDLFYINPAVTNDETPKTAIRQFSRKLVKTSNIIIDYPSEDFSYNLNSFSSYYD